MLIMWYCEQCEITTWGKLCRTDVPSRQCRNLQLQQSYIPDWSHCGRLGGRLWRTHQHTGWYVPPANKKQGSKKESFLTSHISAVCMHAYGRLTGTPWDMRILGFMMVTSWCRRSGWNSNSSGVSFFITSSSLSAATEGTPYQVLGSPLGMRDMWEV